MKNTETDEYREVFNNVCNNLMIASIKLQSGLEAIDVAGAMVAAATETLKHAGRDRAEIAEWLHALAAAIESGQVGFEHRAH